MSHVPGKSQHIVRPDSRKLDAQLKDPDRAHQNRQNAATKAHKTTPPPPKPPKR